MLFTAFAELGVHWRQIGRGFCLVFTKGFSTIASKITKKEPAEEIDGKKENESDAFDPVPPHLQFLALLVGSFFAVIMNVSLLVLFAKAYPCVVQVQDTCEFGLSPVLGWENVTNLLTQSSYIPPSSVYSAIGCAVLSILYVFVKEKYIPENYHPYLPNLNAIGLGFIVHVESHDKYRIAVASGSIAGVGLSALIRASMKIAGYLVCIEEHVSITTLTNNTRPRVKRPYLFSVSLSNACSYSPLPGKLWWVV
ncbi:hypothetical protein HK098_004177 [Nowakowskiella sp. JEL0407]|nr:hypothetical protein HK098_004177 [Nowakowskiella sp. JEL0407]